MGPKRKRSSSARASTAKRSSTRNSNKKVDRTESSDNKATTTNSKDRKTRPTKTKGSEQVHFIVGEEVEYDPVHKGSTRRAEGKVTKVLTGAKKSDPSTKEVRYVIENDNTKKETIYGQHSVKNKAKK